VSSRRLRSADQIQDTPFTAVSHNPRQTEVGGKTRPPSPRRPRDPAATRRRWQLQTTEHTVACTDPRPPEQFWRKCHNPEQAERDQQVRSNLVAHLTQLIAGSDDWTARRRDELVGSVKTKPGLRRYLRRTAAG
jgi:hypothetical protein